MVKPIAAVVDRLKLLAEGDLHADTPIPETNDETATLMSSLAQTVQDLKAVITEMQRHRIIRRWQSLRSQKGSIRLRR